MIDEKQDDTDNRLPPDHPASVEQCDHTGCTRDSPDGRLCEQCDPIMLATAPDECSYCGASVVD
jgi:hypothetical protein